MGRLSTVIVLISIYAVSCTHATPETFTEREADSSPLMGVFASYSSIADIRQQHFPGVMWPIIENSKLAAGDSRPRFDIYCALVPGYTHLGQRGELRLTFFDDRLAEVRFHPEDPDTYLAALTATGLKVTSSRNSPVEEVTVPPHTRVWVMRDYRNTMYVGWCDGRLRSQMTRWIERYS